MGLRTCIYCKQKFDIDKVDKATLVKVTPSRYAHKKCYEDFNNNRLKKKGNEVTLEAVKAYINEALKGTEINWPNLMKEIVKYTKSGYNYEKIYKTLIYCFEVKRIDKFKFNGHIGLINNYFAEAAKYYKDIDKYNELKAIEIKKEGAAKQIKILPPRSKPNIKLIDLEEDLGL